MFKIYFAVFLLSINIIFSLNAEIQLDAHEHDTLQISVDETQWTIRDLGTISSFDGAHLEECNENGQALIRAITKQSPYSFWAIWDSRLGLISIPTGPRIVGKDEWLDDEWLRINGNGQVIGVRMRPAKYGNGYHDDIITWNKDYGYKLYKTPFQSEQNINKFELIARCRNSDLVIINRRAENSEDNQVLALQNNKLTDLTSFLHTQAQSFGYDAGGWTVFDVNNKGMLLGKFCHYEKHPYKNKKLEVSTHYFIQNGDSFYLVDWPEGFQATLSGTPLWDGGHKFEFDANGQVFFCWNNYSGADSMIWNLYNGLTKLECPQNLAKLAEQEGALLPRAIHLLEDGTIVWFMSRELYDQPKITYIFEKNGNYQFLSIDPKEKPSSVNSTKYPGIRIKEPLYYPIFLNNLGFFQVDVFGESHPFRMDFKINRS